MSERLAPAVRLLVRHDMATMFPSTGYNSQKSTNRTMKIENFRKSFCAGLLLLVTFTTATSQRPRANSARAAISSTILTGIVRAEDERRWGNDLKAFLADKDAKVRKRAALAAGRIGDERAVPALVELLKHDSNEDVRQMAAFALGEIESGAGAEALVEVLRNSERVGGDTRARAVEALGKITAALPESDKDRKRAYGEAILNLLRFEADHRSSSNRLTVLLGLTAALRARPDGAGAVIVRFLEHYDPRIVTAALNTMARLRLKDNNDQVRNLLKHGDPLVRANAARVLGAAEVKGAFDALLDRALHDDDLRVRVSAIRALGSLKDARAGEPLLEKRVTLVAARKKSTKVERPTELNEILEIATTLGRVLMNSNSDKAVTWLGSVRAMVEAKAPEVEIALARVAPELYLTETAKFGVGSPESIAQGLRELAAIMRDQPKLERDGEFLKDWMADLLSCEPKKASIRPVASKSQKDTAAGSKCLLEVHPLGVDPFLRTYAAFKPKDLNAVLRKHLTDQDVIVRATAAELLGEQPPNEANARALIEALPIALKDKDLNDAALSILDSLAKQKTTAANDAIKTALDSSDHLLRRRAVTLLKANGAGDFSHRIGTVKTRNTDADYRRAIARIGKQARATIVTSKGAFTMEFLSEEAPLTVDNFIRLARKGFFNGQTIPRVVPNFVVQAGDPRGDQNGGPGYQIRCEINEVPYDRAAVGMALSGKDTGGSQWFVTHSPQPHLDGGYTVFARVVSGMEVVDRIARGDKIRRVIVTER